MSDIFVPVDVSNLKDIIPEGEEIIYSAFCLVDRLLKTSHVIFDSHVILTPKAMYFTRPKNVKTVPVGKFSISGIPTATSLQSVQKRFNSGYGMNSMPLYQIKKLSPAGILLGKEQYVSKDDPNYGKSKVRSKLSAPRVVTYSFRRVEDFESKENFKERRYKFPLKIIPYVIESKKKLIETMQKFPQNYTKADQKRCPKEIQKLEAFLVKMKAKVERKGIMV